MSSVVRQRRYVSAPAGAYPEPVSPRERGSTAAAAVADEPAPPSVDDDPLAPQPACSGSDLDALGTRVALPAAGAAPADLPDPGLDDDSEPAARGRRRTRSPLAGMMLGGLLGLVLGGIAGLLLLALTEGDGTWSERLADIGVVFQQISDPVGLWASVGDPLIRMSAILVAAGFLLLGIGWGGKLGGSRS